MKKFLCGLLAAFMLIGLIGCSASAKPEDTVKGFLEASKEFNFDKMTTYVNMEKNNDLNSKLLDESDKNAKIFIDYLKENAAKITYNITKSEISDNKANVTVNCKYINSEPLLKEVLGEYFIRALSQLFSGKEPSEEEIVKMLGDILTEKKKTAKEEFIEKTITISCIKVDKKWLIESVDEDLQNLITSNFVSASDTINKTFSEGD